MMLVIIAGVTYMHAQQTYTTSKQTTVTTEKYNRNKIVALQLLSSGVICGLRAIQNSCRCTAIRRESGYKIPTFRGINRVLIDLKKHSLPMSLSRGGL